MKTSAITAFVLSVLVGSAVSRPTAAETLALEPRQDDFSHEMETDVFRWGGTLHFRTSTTISACFFPYSKSPLKSTDTWSIWGRNETIPGFAQVSNDITVGGCFDNVQNLRNNFFSEIGDDFFDCAKSLMVLGISKDRLACMDNFRLNLPGKSIRFTHNLIWMY